MNDDTVHFISSGLKQRQTPHPSPEWMGFRWPLMHPVVKLCRSSVLFFMLSLILTGWAQTVRSHLVDRGDLFHLRVRFACRKGVGSSEGQPVVTTGTSCIQHWNDTGELPRLNKHSRIIFYALFATICPISSLPEARRCSDRNRNIFSPRWPRLIFIYEGPPHICQTLHKYFGHVCKLILCTQIRGQSSKDSTIMWITAASAIKTKNLCKVKAIFFLLPLFAKHLHLQVIK